MCADWFITMYKGDNRLRHEVKFRSKGINVLFSEAIEADFADDMTVHNYKEHADRADKLIFTDWLGVSDNARKAVLLTSKDVTRFYKTTAPVGVHNGYAIEGKTVVFSPIQYDLGFEWPDGIGRTIHLDMLLSDKAFSKEAAEKKIRNLNILKDKKAVLENISTNRDYYDEDRYYYSLTFEGEDYYYASAKIDAVTGKVLNFYQDTDYKKLTEDDKDKTDEKINYYLIL
jgi:hypothetical protein